MCKSVNGENNAKHGLVQGKLTFSEAGNVTVQFPYKKCVALIQQIDEKCAALIQDIYLRNVCL